MDNILASGPPVAHLSCIRVEHMDRPRWRNGNDGLKNFEFELSDNGGLLSPARNVNLLRKLWLDRKRSKDAIDALKRAPHHARASSTASTSITRGASARARAARSA
jgi:hypothetical protein